VTAVEAPVGGRRWSPVDWLFGAAPARRLAMLRVLVGGYATVWALVRLPAHLDHVDQPASRWQPVGVLAPLDGPLASAVVVALALVAPLLAACVAAGWRYRVTAPAAALVVLVLATLDSSWVQVFHTENLMVLHLLILAAAPAAADDLVLRRPVGRASAAGARPGGPPASGRHGWPLRLAAVVVVLTYVIAGIAKLRIGGMHWLDGDTLRHVVAYDNLRKDLLGDVYSPVGTRLVAHPWLFPPLAVGSLAVELGAPVALLGVPADAEAARGRPSAAARRLLQRCRTAWVVAAWLFHAGVLALMAIAFPYPLFGVAFAPFFRLERLADRAGTAIRGWRSGPIPETGVAHTP
jgi:hypothetical protein